MNGVTWTPSRGATWTTPRGATWTPQRVATWTHQEEQNGPHQDEQQGPHQEEFCVFLMFCYWFKCYTNPVTDHIMPFEGCKLVIFTRFEFCI